MSRSHRPSLSNRKRPTAGEQQAKRLSASLSDLAALLGRAAARAWLAQSATGAPADDSASRHLTDTFYDSKDER